MPSEFTIPEDVHNILALYKTMGRLRLYRMAQKSVNWLVKYTSKYVRHFFITYWTLKNCLEWDPQYSLHNSQRSDGVLQIDWQV
jgi:hypothetical protein